MPDTILLLSPLATALHARIQQTGLEHKAFAKAAGIGLANLDRLFSGMAVGLPYSDLEATARYFGVSVDMLEHAPPVPAGAKAFRTGRTLLALNSIRPSPQNPRTRFDEDAHHYMVQSIREKGILQNLLVRFNPLPGQPDYEIIAGERRYRGARALVLLGELDPDAPIIPVNVVEADDVEFMTLAILENLQRKDVGPLDEAKGFAKLLALDPALKTSMIAQKIGCSIRHVQLRLSLLEKLCDQAQALLGSGTLKVAQAYVLGTASFERQKEILRHLDRYQTLQQLRDAVTDGLVPVTRAKFDLETFAGELVTLDNGSRYFADREQFLAAQRKAGKTMADAMLEAWSWSEFLEDTWFPSQRFLPGRSDEVGSGVLVLMHPVTGVITIHDQLMPRLTVPAPPAPLPAAPARVEAAPKPADEACGLPVEHVGVDRAVADRMVQTVQRVGQAQQAVQDDREEAAKAFRAELAGRVERDSRTALALLLYDALCPDGEWVLDGTPNDSAGLPSKLFRGERATLKHLDDVVADIGRGRVGLADAAAAEDAWHKMMGTPMLLLLEAFAAWVADHLRVPADEDLPVALRELATVHEVLIPQHQRKAMTAPTDEADLVDRARLPAPQVGT